MTLEQRIAGQCVQGRSRGNDCLDVPGGLHRPGVALEVWRCSGRSNQRFSW